MDFAGWDTIHELLLTLKYEEKFVKYILNANKDKSIKADEGLKKLY